MVPKHSKMKSIYFDSVTSSMDEALNYINDIEEGIIAIIAKEQTKGRGRGEKNWISPKGGFYVTYIIPLENKLSEGELTFFHYAAALAIQEMLNNFFHVKSKIKWPNDILLNDKKIAGVLIEYITGEKCYILIGIGINVNNKPSELIEVELSELIKKNTLYVLETKLDKLVNNFNSNLNFYQKQIYLKDDILYNCKGINIEGNLVLEKDDKIILLSINDSNEIA